MLTLKYRRQLKHKLGSREKQDLNYNMHIYCCTVYSSKVYSIVKHKEQPNCRPKSLQVILQIFLPGSTQKKKINKYIYIKMLIA